MEKISFLDSIIKILNLITSVPFFIEILILSIFLLVMMIFFYFRKSKKGRITSIIIYIVVLVLLPISHISFFASTLDKIIENFIKILYFPSCYVYMALLISTDVSVLINALKSIKEDKKKVVVVIDLVYFIIFQFLFFLIIRLIINNNINVFERTSLYSNIELTSLIQVSSYIFWIRVGIFLITVLVNRLSRNPVLSTAEYKKNITPINSNNNDESVVFNNNNFNNINVDKNNDINKNFVPSFNIGNNSYDRKEINQPNNRTLNNMNGISSILDMPIANNTENKQLNNNNNVNINMSTPVIPTINTYTVVDNNLNNKTDNKLTEDNEINIELNSDDDENYFDDFYD